MNALKKHFSRSTQKLKRTIGKQKHEDETYDAMVSTIINEQRALSHLERHIGTMITSIEAQMAVYRSFGEDVQLLYNVPSIGAASGTVTASNKEQQNTERTESPEPGLIGATHSLVMVDLTLKLEVVAERMDREVVKPFVTKAKEVRERLEQYRLELNQLERSELLKRRHNRLLDFEIVERKFNAAQAKPANTPHAEKELSDLSNQYDTIKAQFDELDRQAKESLQNSIMKRYSETHTTLIEFFSEVVGQYHSGMGKLSQLYYEMHNLVAPQPQAYELMKNHSKDQMELPGKPESSSASSFSKNETGSSGGAAPLLMIDTSFVDETDASGSGKNIEMTESMSTLSLSSPPESRISRTLSLGGPTHSTVEAPYRPKSLDPYEEPTKKTDNLFNFPTSIDDIQLDEFPILGETSTTGGVSESGTGSFSLQPQQYPESTHHVNAMMPQELQFDNREVPSHINVSWFYLNEKGDREGPVTFPELKRLKLNGQVNNDTMVFTDGMNEWVPLSQHIDLPQYML